MPTVSSRLPQATAIIARDGQRDPPAQRRWPVCVLIPSITISGYRASSLSLKLSAFSSFGSGRSFTAKNARRTHGQAQSWNARMLPVSAFRIRKAAASSPAQRCSRTENGRPGSCVPASARIAARSADKAVVVEHCHPAQQSRKLCGLNPRGRYSGYMGCNTGRGRRLAGVITFNSHWKLSCRSGTANNTMNCAGEKSHF